MKNETNTPNNQPEEIKTYKAEITALIVCIVIGFMTIIYLLNGT
jgi:hypothetical protein